MNMIWPSRWLETVCSSAGTMRQSGITMAVGTAGRVVGAAWASALARLAGRWRPSSPETVPDQRELCVRARARAPMPSTEKQPIAKIISLRIGKPSRSSDLALGQLGEKPLLLHQLLVFALLDDSTLPKDINAIRIDDGAQPVGHNDPGGLEGVQAFSDQSLGSVVEGAGCLVKQQDLGARDN